MKFYFTHMKNNFYGESPCMSLNNMQIIILNDIYVFNVLTSYSSSNLLKQTKKLCAGTVLCVP
jgi:hypothetical protein